VTIFDNYTVNRRHAAENGSEDRLPHPPRARGGLLSRFRRR